MNKNSAQQISPIMQTADENHFKPNSIHDSNHKKNQRWDCVEDDKNANTNFNLSIEESITRDITQSIK